MLLFAIQLHGFILLRFVVKYILSNVGPRLGAGLRWLFIFVAITFARIMNLFFFSVFFVLFIGPGYIIEFFSSKPPDESFTPIFRLPKDMPKDMPKGWVRIRICPTDEISDFNLTENEENCRDWEARQKEIYKTMEDVHRSVGNWLDIVDGNMIRGGNT